MPPGQGGCHCNVGVSQSAATLLRALPRLHPWIPSRSTLHPGGAQDLASLRRMVCALLSNGLARRQTPEEDPSSVRMIALEKTQA